MSRAYPPKIQQAFDELRFGPSRTLNLRASLPSAADARARTEAWLREKQVERAEEVLIITGRGNSSEGGVSVVRQTVLALFPSLRRRNVIAGWQEHTAGSFVVSLAPIMALFEVPKRRREKAPQPLELPSLAALDLETVSLLRELAVASLVALGVHDIDRFVKEEMIAKFAALSASLPLDRYTDATTQDTDFRAAIQRALDELGDS